MWGALLEKAFAKYWGNYSHTVGGLSFLAIKTFQGGPSFEYDFKNAKLDDAWNAIVKATKNGDIMSTGTPGADDTEMNSNGLYYGHAFSLLGGVTLNDGTRLVKIRNPHGVEAYKGPWGDTSDKWTDALRAEVNQKMGEASPHVLDVNDAAFWMPFTDTAANLGGMAGQMDGFMVNYDVTGWHSDYFLRLDDDGTGTSKSTEWNGTSR